MVPEPTVVRPKPEHEKWKAMVDSVVDFISASRTMLYALNERTEDTEEEVGLNFYKERLNYLEVEDSQHVKVVKESGDFQPNTENNKFETTMETKQTQAPLETKCQNPSKIPRAKSNCEKKSESHKCQKHVKEVTYSDLHRRSKTQSK